MTENIRVENWCGYDIRFVEHDGAWYAVLKDICDALDLRTAKVKTRIDSLHLIKAAVTRFDERPVSYNVANNFAGPSQGPTKIDTQMIEHTYEMLCVDEAGIYQALNRSTRLEARKFIDWISHSLVDLRKAVGLEGYEALRLTESGVQKLIADKIDISFMEPTGDLVPVKAEPTIVQNITNVNVDYRKVVTYGVLGGVCVVAVCAGVVYIVKRVKSKKAEKEEREHNKLNEKENNHG